MPPAIPDAGRYDRARANAPMCRSIQEHHWGFGLDGAEGRRLQLFIEPASRASREVTSCRVRWHLIPTSLACTSRPRGSPGDFP
jgi:hypothetical protein